MIRSRRCRRNSVVDVAANQLRGQLQRRLVQGRLECLEPRQMLAGDATLRPDFISVRQNSEPAEVDVLANDVFSADYDGLREITSVSFGSDGGRVDISEDGKSLIYAPPADYEGTETLSYFVDGTHVAEVTIDIQSPLFADEYTIHPDGEWHTLDVMENDPFWAGYDGDREITLTSFNRGLADLRISDDGSSIQYRASDFDSGTDRFIYIVDSLYSTSVTVNVPETLGSDFYEVLEDADAQRYDVLSNDFAEWRNYSGERKITAIVRPDVNDDDDEAVEPTLRISADGEALIYAPAPDFNGTDRIRYVVDGRYEASLTFRVLDPVRGDWSEVDLNSQDFPIEVVSNDVYYSSILRRNVDAVSDVTSVDSASEEGGTVSLLNRSTVLYTPPADFEGSDRFSYTADGRYEAWVNVEVSRPVRDDFVRVFQDTPNQLLGVLRNDFLGNGYEGPKQITSVRESDEGVTSTIVNGGVDAGGGLRYTPPEMYVGSDQLTYNVDGDLAADVHVSVMALAENDYFRECSGEGRTYTLNVLADDNFQRGYQGPGLITSVTSEDALGTATISADSRRLLYTPNGRSHDQFTYTVDGKYEASVSISLTNHLSGDHIVVRQNDGQTSVDVLANDFGVTRRECQSVNYRGARQITAVGQSEQGGTVRLAEDGRNVLYEPPVDYFGQDAFTYTVDNVMTTTVHVDVARHVRDDQFRVDPNGQATLSVLANDLFSKYDGAQQITDVTASGAGATIAISSDGRHLEYTAPDGFVGTDTVTYTVDGRLKADVVVSVQAEGESVFPRFESIEQLQSFLLDDALTRHEHLFGQSYYNRSNFLEGDFLLADGSFEQGPRVDEKARDVSETNVQVEGIDEADLMEFDQDYLYMITGDDVVILNAWPAEELAEVSRVTIPGNVFGQYLNGDRLTVVSERVTYEQPLIENNFDPTVDIAGDVAIRFDTLWWPYFNPTYETIVTVLDVSDRAAPTVVQESTLEGKLVQTRSIGDYVYVSVTNEAIAPEPELIEDEEGNLFYEDRDVYIERVLSQPGAFLDDSLPNFVTTDSQGQMARSGLLHEPEDIYRPISENATNIVSLVSINVKNDTPGLAGSSGVYTEGAAEVYASHQHFYVFENVYNAEDGNLTQILQFDWDVNDGSAKFSASGQVAGSMVNQFSADEYDGHLRIATTVSNSGAGNYSRQSDNNLFVLRDNGGVMEFTGSLQNLALGETIRSVRFMGPRAFVVTFRNVDPLFGIDVEDHTAPKAVGHLTLPGFSSYMQLIEEDFLLTVGKNTPDGRSGPTQVSLFNVSDLARPVLVDEYTFERFSRSEAEADHHAFGYYSRHGMLAIPVVRSHTVRSDEDQDGFAETRKFVVDHQLTVLNIDTTATPRTNTGIQFAADIAHDSLVRRSGYIDNKLYSIAENSVNVVDVAAPNTIVATASDLKPEPPQIEEPILPWWPEDEVAVFNAEAQADLANHLKIEPASVLPVTLEQTDGTWQSIVRVDETYYRYVGDANGGQPVLAEEGFQFDPAGTSGVRQNSVEPLDVNGDGHIAPSDALFVINALGNATPESNVSVVRQINGVGRSEMLDTNGDGQVSPIDALLVINRLNEQTELNLNTQPLNATNPATLQDIAAVEDFFNRVRETAGDANLDGRFDSSDVVQAFQGGKYETDQPATWQQGDWDGDQRFTTADIVLAFTYGKYV